MAPSCTALVPPRTTGTAPLFLLAFLRVDLSGCGARRALAPSPATLQLAQTFTHTGCRCPELFGEPGASAYISMASMAGTLQSLQPENQVPSLKELCVAMPCCKPCKWHLQKPVGGINCRHMSQLGSWSKVKHKSLWNDQPNKQIIHSGIHLITYITLP